ncbi:MAG: plasma-membrane proton-efflux P-type ATPase, partial [Chloroflexi bacterium]|nr:plasma-membrane proton-efflux P-type ATPase [Chloroflexota bacterium]
MCRAARRSKVFGRNELVEKRANLPLAFLKKFWGITPWMLELTMLISGVLGKYLELYVIGALLLLNSILAFLQEQRADDAVRHLKQRLQVTARVLRDGKWDTLPATDLVPGDVVRVRVGDFVPADLKMASGELEVDQSALSGESLPVKKKENEVLYSGSIVRSGESTSIVLATGLKTFYGRTAQLVQTAKPKLHSEAVTSRVATWLLMVAGTLIVLTLAVSVFKGQNIREVLPLALVLLISAIPVALPTMFTLTMALGSMELARKGVLVTRLSASEDAATMDTICVDKTGTITMNRLAITEVFPSSGFSETDVILYGALASQEANRDPIDAAFMDAAVDRKLPLGEYAQREFTPFNPQTRRTEALVEGRGRNSRIAKGAVREIARLSGLTNADIDGIESSMGELANKGYRTLAVALDNGDGHPNLVGLVALYDKPRPDSARLLAELRALGVSVKMLTGDALPIARETAKQVGLGQDIVGATELIAQGQHDMAKIAQVTESSDGFAEVYPEDKYTIVKSLQSRGHVVGMTGDGVNDAPALRQAEVGVAPSNATDVAKGAASVVLTGEGLSNVIDLVKIGRMIHQR